MLRKHSLRNFIPAIFSCLLILFSPVTNIFDISLKAESTIWTNLSSNEFSTQNSEVIKFIKDTQDSSLVYFFTPQKRVFEYNGTTTTNILDLYSDSDTSYFIDLASANNLLYLLVSDYTDTRVLLYKTEMGWNNISSLPAEITDIYSIGTYQNKLALWLEIEDVSRSMYTFDGVTWTEISTNPLATYNNADLDSRGIYNFGGKLYLSTYNVNNSKNILFEYNGTSWSNMGMEFDYTITDVAFFANKLHIITSDYSNPFNLLRYEAPDFWVMVSEDGILDSTNINAKLAVVQGNLYLTTTSNSGSNAKLYKYNRSEFTLLSSYIGVENPPEGQNNYTVTAMIDYGNHLLMNSGWPGEGPYHATIWDLNMEIDDYATNTHIQGDDACEGPFDLGFDFTFFGNIVSQVYISTNGTVGFNGCFSGYHNVDLSDSLTWPGGDEIQLNTIYAYWDDLETNDLKNIFVKSIGESPNRQFVIQWTNIYHNIDYFSVPVGTIQIILTEGSNEVQLQYQDIFLGNLGAGNSATIGMSQSEENLIHYSYHEQVVESNKAVKFVPSGINYTIDDNPAFQDIYLRDYDMPASPNLVTPSSNATGVSTLPYLRWNHVEGVANYTVVISRTENFEKGAFDNGLFAEGPENTVDFIMPDINGNAIYTSEQVGSTNVTVNGEEFVALQPNTQYYWYVMAQGQLNNSISQVGRFTTGSGIDSDFDKILDSEEDAGPNSGDANNDSTPDSQQANVTSFVNPITNNYVVLQTSCGANSSSSITNTNTLTSDSGFTYPAGLLNFTLQCSVEQTATINQYFYEDVDASKYVARKYTEGFGYRAITGAEVSNVSIGGQGALKITYQITDGGSLDEDATANGVIVDPSGPALSSVGAPNTGRGGLSRR